MDAITIPVIVGEDRRILVKLPDSTPVGPAEVDVIVRPRPPADAATGVDTPRSVNPALEAAREKFRAAGLLSNITVPEGAVLLSNEEIARIGRLPPGARPSEELVDEDRGLY